MVMRRTASSGLISTKHILDVQEAALRYRISKALQGEMARLKDFQAASVTEFEASLKRLQAATVQQAADLKSTFQYQCESLCERLQALITRMNKDKRVLEAVPTLTQVLTKPQLVTLQASSDLSAFQLTAFLTLSAAWTALGQSFFPLPKASISAHHIPANASVSTHSKQVRLDLSSQGTNASDLQALVPLIPRYSSVVELDLSYSALDREAVEAVGQCVKGLEQLERLVLKGNTLDGGLLRALCLNAGVRRGVKWLNLEENRLGSTAHCLTNSLSQAFPSLQVLLLKRNSLLDSDLHALSHDLIHLPLHTLDLSHNCLTSTGVHSLSLLLPHISSLVYLDLGGNKIGDEGVASLGKTLPYVTRLVGLGLRGNEVTERGARGLAQAAEEMMWLEGIHLEDNNIRASSLTSPQRRLLHL